MLISEHQPTRRLILSGWSFVWVLSQCFCSSFDRILNNESTSQMCTDRHKTRQYPHLATHFFCYYVCQCVCVCFLICVTPHHNWQSSKTLSVARLNGRGARGQENVCVLGGWGWGSRKRKIGEADMAPRGWGKGVTHHIHQCWCWWQHIAVGVHLYCHLFRQQSMTGADEPRDVVAWY